MSDEAWNAEAEKHRLDKYGSSLDRFNVNLTASRMGDYPELLAADMPEHTYTDRDVKAVKVRSKDEHSVTWDDGWSWGAPGILDRLEIDREYLYETVGFSEVTGVATMYRTRSGEPVVDEWLMHKTDAERERERAEWLANYAREKEGRWEANQADWREREARLPLSLRRRLERFRANGGHEFEVDGWGYELVVCELAVLYAASGQEDDATVDAYAHEQGTSGNQHDYAKALSRRLTDEPEDEDAVANSVSALSPLTGNADYTKAATP